MGCPAGHRCQPVIVLSHSGAGQAQQGVSVRRKLDRYVVDRQKRLLFRKLWCDQESKDHLVVFGWSRSSEPGKHVVCPSFYSCWDVSLVCIGLRRMATSLCRNKLASLIFVTCIYCVKLSLSFAI